LITQISKEDYRDFWTFSEISLELFDNHPFLGYFISKEIKP